jgi:type I restriction enzyme S subunit
MNTETQNPACTPKPKNTNHLSEWKKVKLGDAINLIKDTYKPDGNDRFIYIGLEHIEPETLRLFSIGNSSDIKSNKFKFKSNDILFGKLRPYFRKVIKPKFEGVCSTDIWVFRANEKFFDQNFLFYFLANWEFINTANHGESGTRMPRADWNFLKNTSWIIPPLPEQQAIAEMLSSLDDKIDLLHRQNKTLEALAETLFRQWFIEEADERWEVVPLESFFDFLEGPGIRNWQYTETGTPFINIRLINNGDIDVSKANYISNEEANGKYSHFHLKEGDMVVSTSGTLGKTAIVRKYHLPLILNTSVIRFRPKDENNYSFMYQYLKSKLFQEHLESLASGSVQANFGPTHLKAMKIQKPSLDALKSYSAKADPLYSKLKSNQTQIRTLTQLRDTLLPKLMSGEVRVLFL